MWQPDVRKSSWTPWMGVFKLIIVMWESSKYKYFGIHSWQYVAQLQSKILSKYLKSFTFFNSQPDRMPALVQVKEKARERAQLPSKCETSPFSHNFLSFYNIPVLSLFVSLLIYERSGVSQLPSTARYRDVTPVTSSPHSQVFKFLIWRFPPLQPPSHPVL